MNIKLDENMPTEIVEMLEELGHGVETVPQELLAGKSDAVIRRAARSESRFLITQDKRFVDARAWEESPGPGVMLLRIPDATRASLIHAVHDAFRREPVETWVGKIVVVTRNKVRVRPLIRKET